MNISLLKNLSIVILAISLLEIAIPVCVLAKHIQFAPYDQNATSEWEKEGFQGSAWVVIAETFHTKGNLPWWSFISIANVAPVQTDIILSGTIFDTISGIDRTGQRIDYVERWKVKGRHPYPDNHPINFFSGGTDRIPFPLIVVSDSDEQFIKIFTIERLKQQLRKLIWNKVINTALAEEQVSGFLFAGPSRDPLEGAYLKRSESLSRIRSAGDAGYAFDVIDQGWFVGIYPIDPKMKNGLKPQTGIDKAYFAVNNYFSVPRVESKLFIANPIKAHNIRTAKNKISELITTEKKFSLSRFWFLEQTWMVITEEINQNHN